MLNLFDVDVDKKYLLLSGTGQDGKPEAWCWFAIPDGNASETGAKTAESWF